MSDETEKHIEAIESKGLRTGGLSSLDDDQLASFSKIISLVQETPESRRQLSEATRSRHKAAQRTIKAIFQHSTSLFLLCVLTLPPTRLASIKDPDKFINELLDWWRPDRVTPAFHKLTTRLVAANRNAFEKSGFILPLPEMDSPHSRENSPIIEWNNKGFDRSDPKRRCIEYTNQSSVSKPREDFETHDEHDNEDDSEITSSDEDNGQTSSDDYLGMKIVRDNPPTPLQGSVYKLKPIDIARILLDNKDEPEVDYVLTMPSLQGAKPFITIHCPNRLAVRFLTKRERMPW